jgi:protein involved in polysaccharide export with SLBB domain
VAVFNLPDFSVGGVLRSELEDKLGAYVGRFLRNAAVRTTLLTRVSVTGAVTKPGFYYAVPDRPINDLLTSAGGPLADANVAKLSVSRMGRRILSERAAKRAMEAGITLEALDVQSGDTVHIPLKRKVNWQLVVQLAFVTMSLFFALLQFMQWYYNRQDA